MPKAAPVECTVTADGGHVILRKTGGQSVRYKSFKYTQLSGGRSIRLLKHIRAASDDASYDHFSIEERSLDDPTLRYVAISYVWGDSSVKAPLIVGNEIDGSALLITKTAWEAIETLCTFDTLLWIDQVCIHQEDDKEVKQQITLMGQIYSSPRRWVTAVWLGAADEDTQTAFNLIEQLSKVMPLTKDIPINADNAFQMPHDVITRQIQTEYPAYRPPADGDPSWASLGKLIARRWYSRMWTFQEVVLTELDSVSVISANQELLCVTNLRKLLRASILLGDYRIPSDNTAMTEGRASLRLINTTQHRVQNHLPTTFHYLLQVTANRDCHDPKDKIYGLLDVQRNVLPMETIEVDPKKPPEEVGRLKWKVQQLPSWVPDYSAAILAGYFEALDPNAPVFSASHGRRWKDSAHPNGSALSWKQLLVQGRSIDTVEEICDDVMPAEASGDDMYSYLRRVLPTLLSQALRLSNEDDKDKMMLRIARTLIAGGYSSYMFGLRAFSFIQRVTSASYEANAMMSPPRKHADDLVMLRREYFEHFDSHISAPMTESARQWNIDFTRQATYCKGRRFAFLKKYGVSLVPQQTAKGDIVTILHGSSLPVILRGVGDENTFRLVGSCYVDGIMLGEAVNGVEDKADSFVLV